MKSLKRLFCLILMFIVISTFSFADDYIESGEGSEESISVSVDVTTEEPRIDSRRAIVFERNSKTVLYEKNAYEQCKMASTTKIMTSIIILENCDLSTVATISSKAANTQGSRLGLHTNDTITVNDLLYGLMLCSGNDAAVALAEFCSGSVEDFAVLMNNKAAELHLDSTNFVTPHGLDNENHYTTAYDFAILTDYALTNPQFVQIVGTKQYTVTLNGAAKNIHNTNELLGAIPSVYGVKTGYTSQAGRCLISAAKQDDLDIIVIVFGADTKNIRTNDSVKLINYIFSNFEIVNITELVNAKYSDFQNYILPYINVVKSADSLNSKLEDNSLVLFPIKKNLRDSILVLSSEEKGLQAPIYENQKIGEISVFLGNTKIYGTNIVSATYINKKSAWNYFYYFVMNYKDFYQIL